MKQDTPYTSIGGQAVIEGVMMRSPHFVTVAVRKPNGRIALRNQNYKALTQRVNWLRKPILRGVATLVESLVQGVEALSYSASVASESEKENETLSSWAIASSIGIAFLLGMGLFVALPISWPYSLPTCQVFRSAPKTQPFIFWMVFSKF